MKPTEQAQLKVMVGDQGIKLTTFIPVGFIRHKARKVLIEPTMPGWHATPVYPGQAACVDENLMSALARACFWQGMLDEGKVGSIAELAKAESIDKVWVQKILRLACLAPDLMEDIAFGRQSVGLSLEYFLSNPLPGDWEAQRRKVAGLVPG